MDVRVASLRKLSAKELMLLNCRVEEDSWESLDCKEIQIVHPKGNQSWIFTGRTDAEVEAEYFCHLLWRTDSLEKTLMLGKDWRQEDKEMTEDEMVGWHHWLNGHEFEQTPGVGEGQEGLACCSPWGRKELDTTEWLNGTELNIFTQCLTHYMVAP